MDPILIGLIAVAAIAFFLKRKKTSVAGAARSLINSTASRPVASAWSKQVAADMLDEIAIADERAKVIETMKRAVAIHERPPSQPAESASRDSESLNPIFGD